MCLIDGDAVHRLLDYPRRGVAACPLRANAGCARDVHGRGKDSGRGFIMLPAWRGGDMLGVKLVTVFPGNPGKNPPLPANQGLYVAFDGKTGVPALIVDGIALTLRKTAADSALGVDILA